MTNSPKTIFCDIDGVLLEHPGNKLRNYNSAKMLPGTLEKLKEWDKMSYKIILVTGRRESEREATVTQLQDLGIIYDMLIMGVGRGARVIVNDLKPNQNEDMAIAVNLIRNQGIKGIKI